MIEIQIDYIINQVEKEGLTGSELINKIYERCQQCVPVICTYEMIENRFKKINGYRKNLEHLKNVKQYTQRTTEWYNIRHTMITASDMAQALGKGKYGNQKEFIMKKCEDVPFSLDNPILRWGIMFEDVAMNIYKSRYDININEMGLIPHSKYNFFGASPDGISDNGIMLEIKCPPKRKIDGAVLEQYFYQIQGQLDACNLEECDFLECKFSKYMSKRDMWEDNDPSGILNELYNEKGAIFEYIDENNNSKYVYSPHLCTKEKFEEWEKATIDKYKEYMYIIHYWYLDEINIKRVFRDRNFFDINIKKIEHVWSKILDYRKDKDLYNEEVIKSKKKMIIDTDTIGELISEKISLPYLFDF